jgi:hypothetical protein
VQALSALHAIWSRLLLRWMGKNLNIKAHGGFTSL